MKLRKELAEKLRWAVEHSPCSAEYKGDITLEEREEIERHGFEIYTFAVFMNGGGILHIRWYNH